MNKKKSAGFLIGFLFVLLVSPLFSMAQMQDNCETALSEAQKMYRVGRSAEVIKLLTQCLPSGIQELERVQAYRLLALAYIARDYPSQAKDVIEKILDLNENFEPDYTQDNKTFIEFVEKDKKARAQKKSRKNRWFLIGGGALVAGVISSVILTSGASPIAQRLPDPPEPPDNE